MTVTTRVMTSGLKSKYRDFSLLHLLDNVCNFILMIDIQVKVNLFQDSFDIHGIKVRIEAYIQMRLQVHDFRRKIGMS